MSPPSTFIPFNQSFIIGNELEYIAMAVASGHLSAKGGFTQRCQEHFRMRYGISKSILTHSCTGALELAALLLDIKPGDEIIAPSFAFVSTVNPFVMRGAAIVFADSSEQHPNMDAEKVESLITPRTKAIVCVHYAGMACDMEKLNSLSVKYGIPVIEDAAHAIESKWKGEKQLGTIGRLGAFSFHETKNIISGEGGLLCVNDESLFERADILSEKGTNRSAFFRGEINKYEWVDIGSSFLSSELTTAYLFAQLEMTDKIQQRRIALWNQYHSELGPVEQHGFALRPFIPPYSMTNGHIYYLVCKSEEARNSLILSLKNAGIQAVFHYQSLHKSLFYRAKYAGPALPNADRYSECLVRLPFFYGLEYDQVSRICREIRSHFRIPV